MLRYALLSLLAAIALVVLGTAIATIRDQSAPGPGREVWYAKDMQLLAGAKLNSASSHAVTLDPEGKSIMEIDGRGVLLSDLPLLHLKFRGRPDVLAMVVGWRSDAHDGAIRSRRIGFAPSTSFWLDMSSERDWTGRLSSLAVILLGDPGSEVELESVQMLPRVFPFTLFLPVSDWLSFVPWQFGNINTYSGVSVPGMTPYPAVIVAVTMLIAMLVLLAGISVFRQWRRFRWSNLGILFFLCWLFIDGLWQLKLFRQVELTRATFAGKSVAEKRRADIDGGLYEFVSRAGNAIGQSDARIFVSSSSDYSGMRSAYYLYPRNVYWERHAQSLPEARHLRPGDYILLLSPAEPRFDVETGYLSYGENTRLKAQPLLASGVGALYRLI
jgi:hypothetical protein